MRQEDRARRSSIPRRTGTCSPKRPSSSCSQDKVAVTFGCWTSVSRKSVLPVFEKQQRPALLPRAVRGRGVLEERLLHGRHAQSAAHPGRRVPDDRRRGADTRSSTCSAPTTCSRAPRTRSCAPSCSPRAFPPTNIVEEYTPFDHQDYQTIVGKIKTLLRRRQRGGAFDHQRRQQRAVLQGIRQSGPDRSENARSWPSPWPRTSCAPWTPSSSSVTSPRGTTTSRWIRPRTRSSWRPSRSTRRRTTCPAATSA